MVEAKSLADAALEMAVPELYRKNAFRLLGLSVNASQQQITRRRQELALEAKLGTGGEHAAGMPLAVIPAPDEDALREAARRLRDPESRFLDELLWPWPLGAQDAPDAALTALEHGDAQGAIATWEAASKAPAGWVADHNLAVIYHLLALDLECLGGREGLAAGQVRQKKAYWAQALAFWRAAFASDDFWGVAATRAQRLRDPRLDGEALAGLKARLPAALLCINGRLAARAAQAGDDAEARWHARLAHDSSFEAEAVEQALLLAAQPTRDAVKPLCADADREVEAAPRRGGEAAGRLMDAAGPLLAVLDALLPGKHQALVAVHDEVAVKVLRLQIAYASETHDWALSLQLLQRALPLARGAEAKKRLTENIAIVEGNLRSLRCWFCQEKPRDEGARVLIPMFKITGRLPVPGGVRIQYQTAKVPVPRCGRCRAVHRATTMINVLALTAGIVLGLGGCARVLAGHGPQVNGLFVLALGWAAGAIIGKIASRMARPKKVKPEGVKMEFPEIKKLKREGWSVGSKPST